MSTTTVLIVVLILAVAAIAALGWILYGRRRSRNLRTRFGPEYERTVQQYGEPTRAERDLEARQKRMGRINIRPLTSPEQERFAERWQTIQARFVDDPAGTIREADQVVTQIMVARGYPMVEFDGRADDLSVDHPYVVTHYRVAHQIALSEQSGTATTEDLRRAVVHYRELVEELLERQLVSKR